MQSYKLTKTCEKEWVLEIPAILTDKELEKVTNFLHDKGCSADIRTSQFGNGFIIMAVPGCQITKTESHNYITKYNQTLEICSLQHF